MSIIELIKKAETGFEKAGIETPRLDAEVLLAHVLGKKRFDLYAEKDLTLTDAQIKEFKTLVEKRANHCPVAYLTGTKEFWSIDIKVTPDVLIPRPETETVVEETLKRIRDKNAPVEILDLCTGSGCIAAALAKELPNAKFTLVDISEAAINIARKNLSFASDRCIFLTGDLFKAISLSHHLTISPLFDFITCNPPYISEDEKDVLPPDIAKYEPHAALFSGKLGLDLIEIIIKNAPAHLKSGGWLIMEIGMGQSGQIKKFTKSLGVYTKAEVVKDLSGIDRVISICS